MMDKPSTKHVTASVITMQKKYGRARCKGEPFFKALGGI